MEISRRRFLVLSAFAAGSSLLPPGCGEATSSGSDRPDDSDEPDEPTGPSAPDRPGDIEREHLPATELEWTRIVEEYFAGAEAEDVRELGRQYVRTIGDDGGAVVDDLGRVVEFVAEHTDMQSALERLDRAVVEDFEQPRVVSVQGWQLAAAESQLAAHYHLLVG